MEFEDDKGSERKRAIEQGRQKAAQRLWTMAIERKTWLRMRVYQKGRELEHIGWQEWQEVMKRTLLTRTEHTT